MFLQEQELYQKEGLGVNEVHYVDNQDCIGESVPASLLWPHLLLKLIKWLISAFSKWPKGNFVLWWSICKSTTHNVLISFGRMVFNPSRDFMLLCFFSLICYLVSVRTLDGSREWKRVNRLTLWGIVTMKCRLWELALQNSKCTEIVVTLCRVHTPQMHRG